MTSERRTSLIYIHQQLHLPVSEIRIAELRLPILISNTRQSSVKYEDKVLIKQPASSNSVYGRLVKAGHKITCIARSGKKWGYIIDDEILDPLDGE